MGCRRQMRDASRFRGAELIVCSVAGGEGGVAELIVVVLQGGRAYHM